MGRWVARGLFPPEQRSHHTEAGPEEALALDTGDEAEGGWGECMRVGGDGIARGKEGWVWRAGHGHCLS